ncbi:MAG: metalloregulator ArsR/SmtB family transcription factor, partial [Pseudomonadota bacterium]
TTIFEQISRIGKAISHPKRLEIMELLSQSERTVDSLTKETGLSQANTSQHLKALRACELISSRRDGTSIWYRLSDDSVADFFRALRVLAVGHLSELEKVVGEYFSGHREMAAVDKKTLTKKARAGEVSVIDVRPLHEYESGHIPGAISIPIDELEKRLAEIPKRQQVVAYCRGPYCVWSVEAVKKLEECGYRAVHLRDGVLDWRAQGYKVKTGDEP